MKREIASFGFGCLIESLRIRVGLQSSKLAR